MVYSLTQDKSGTSHHHTTGVVESFIVNSKKDVSIFFNILTFVIFLAKNSWQPTCYCEFYLCYSPQKTVLTFFSLQVAVRSRHARTVQTSDYSAVALKVCYSVIKEKICFTNFLFGPRNSHPHVYWSVPGDGFKKPFTGWFLQLESKHPLLLSSCLFLLIAISCVCQ